MKKRKKILHKSIVLTITLTIMLFSCKDYEPKDFCGEWYYNNTKFVFHDNGSLEIYNLDTIFVYWDNPQLSKYHKDIWKIQKYSKWDNRIYIGLDTIHSTTFIIENKEELSYYIGDPDEDNCIVIRKRKNN